MVMMDDERNRKNFNETRLDCLLRTTNNSCNLIKSSCEEDEPYKCPLFVFIKKLNSHDKYR